MAERTCSRCAKTKPVAEFHKKAKGGYQAWCIRCMAEHQKEWVKANSERRIATRLWTKYRIRMDVFEAMLAAQGNGCRMCREPFTTRHSIKVDHDHACCPGLRTCGKCVRGLLCNGCNIFLGVYEDQARRQLADEYLALVAQQDRAASS
jgi:hypothetical protein